MASDDEDDYMSMVIEEPQNKETFTQKKRREQREVRPRHIPARSLSRLAKRHGLMRWPYPNLSYIHSPALLTWPISLGRGSRSRPLQS